MRSSVQVWNDNVLDEPLVREDQVVAVVVEKDELAGFVKGPKTYPVLKVDRWFPRFDDLQGDYAILGS